VTPANTALQPTSRAVRQTRCLAWRKRSRNCTARSSRARSMGSARAGPSPPGFGPSPMARFGCFYGARAGSQMPRRRVSWTNSPRARWVASGSSRRAQGQASSRLNSLLASKAQRPISAAADTMKAIDFEVPAQACSMLAVLQQAPRLIPTDRRASRGDRLCRSHLRPWRYSAQVSSVNHAQGTHRRRPHLYHPWVLHS
jgi:hypothetical protein